ncbi:hypothetical protein ACTFIV_005299 [Dictyostelium citrinum]
MNSTRNIISLVRRYSTSRSVKIASYGSPSTSLKIENENITDKISNKDVLVEMLHAPINPADLNIIQGTYGTNVQVGGVAGMEGVGVVKKVGSGVTGLKENDLVVPSMKQHFGSWRSKGVWSEQQLLKVPSDIPTEYLSTISINPTTAYLLLNDFVKLAQGDVIIQNASNSMVGLSVIQMAKARGIKTINVIRNSPEFEDNVQRLKQLGGDIVVSEEYVRTPAFRKLISDLPSPKLALNAVGGQSATELSRILADNGTLVTYGGMSREPVTIPTSQLIFRNIQIRGFWLNKWIEQHTDSEKQSVYDAIFDLIRKKQFKLMIEKHKFSEFDQALLKSQQSGHGRKIVLDLQL